MAPHLDALVVDGYFSGFQFGSLDADALGELHEESTTYCTAHPGTNAAKHFAYMIEHWRARERYVKA